MSDEGLGIPLDVVQANLDSYLGALIVQSFVSGLYTLLLFRTVRSAAAGLRKGSNVFLMLLLFLLYCLIMSNLATTWVVARSVFITNNATRDDMTNQLFNNTSTLSEAGNACGVIAILIADSLLVWRCYMLWNRNKILLGFFSLLLLGELALIPVVLIVKKLTKPDNLPVISIYFFISMGLTVVATIMIAYRIITVSRGGPSQYNYVVEVLVESGVLYSTILFISGVLQSQAQNPSLSLFEAGTYFTGILIPVTGIAPTLISARILTHTDEDDQRWSKPVSFLVFNTIHRHNAGSATLHGGETSFGLGTKTGTMRSDEEKGSLSHKNESPDLEFAPVPHVSASQTVRTGDPELTNRNGFL